MKNLDDKIIMAFYGVFGGGLGFLIYAFGLGGMKFLLLNRTAKPWNGLTALNMCGVGFRMGHCVIQIQTGNLVGADRASMMTRQRHCCLRRG